MIPLVWLLLSILVGFLGRYNLLGFWGNFFLSFLLSPVAGLIAVALIRDSPAKTGYYPGAGYYPPPGARPGYPPGPGGYYPPRAAPGQPPGPGQHAPPGHHPPGPSPSA